MTTRRFAAAAFACVCLATPARARAQQTGVVAGTVVDASSGTPLPGVTITIADTAMKTLSAHDGTFTFAAAPVGRRQLVVSSIGYGLAKPVVNVTAGATVTITIPLAEGVGTYSDKVTVQGDRFRPAGDITPGAQVLTSGDMQDLRGVLTDDPFRAIQALPGVTTGDDFRSEFAIRGSDFSHLGLSVDGISSRWLTHQARGYESNGSVALLQADTVGTTSLFAGAAPQELPGRTGARIDFGLREGSRAATAVHASISMTSASAVAEGPLGKSKRGSWIASIRQSYVQWVLARLHFDGAAFGFMDGQAKLVYDVKPSQQLQVTFLAGRSRLNLTDPNDPSAIALSTGTGHSGLAILGWRSTFGSSLVVTQQAAALWDQFHNEADGHNVLADGTESELAYRAHATWTMNAHWTMQAGAYLQKPRENSFSTAVIPDPGVQATNAPGEFLLTTDARGSAHSEEADGRLTWTPSRMLTLDAGAQISHSTLNSDTPVSPWLLAELVVTSALRIHAGVARSSQAPTLEQTIGFCDSCRRTIATLGDRDAVSERARDYDLGLEYRLSPAVRLEASGYARREEHVLRLENIESRLDANGSLVDLLPPNQPFWSNALTGSARGLEFTLQRRAQSGLSGWLSYSYAHARYADSITGESYAADADQRHTLNVYAQYRRSTRTSFSVKFRAGSNFPIAGYLDQRPAGLFIGPDRNTVRLPAYARLDLRANRTFTYSKRRLTLFVEVINALNRANYAPSLGYFTTSGQAKFFTSSLFPFLPSAGIVIDF